MPPLCGFVYGPMPQPTLSRDRQAIFPSFLSPSPLAFFYLTKPAISVLSFPRNLAKGTPALFFLVLLSSNWASLVFGALAISFVLFQSGNINSLEGISAQQKSTLMCKQKGRFGTKHTQTGGRLLAKQYWRIYLSVLLFVSFWKKSHYGSDRERTCVQYSNVL